MVHLLLNETVVVNVVVELPANHLVLKHFWAFGYNLACEMS